MRSKAGCRPTEIPVRWTVPGRRCCAQGLGTHSAAGRSGCCGGDRALGRGRGLAAATPGAEAVAEQAETRAAAHIAAATAVKPRSAGRGGCGSRSAQRVAGRNWRRACVTAGCLVVPGCLVEVIIVSPRGRARLLPQPGCRVRRGAGRSKGRPPHARRRSPWSAGGASAGSRRRSPTVSSPVDMSRSASSSRARGPRSPGTPRRA